MLAGGRRPRHKPLSPCPLVHVSPTQKIRLGQHVVLSLPNTDGGSCAEGKGAFTERMLGVIQLARVVTGSVLIIVGLIAIPLPLTPGLPLIILGASIGLTWHPKGLRLWRRWRVKAGRKWQAWRGQSPRGDTLTR